MLANDQRDVLQTKQIPILDTLHFNQTIPILDTLHFTIMLAGS